MLAAAMTLSPIPAQAYPAVTEDTAAPAADTSDTPAAPERDSDIPPEVTEYKQLYSADFANGAEIVLTEDTCINVNADAVIKSISGSFELAVIGPDDKTLTIKGSKGHGVSVNSLYTTASIDVTADKDAFSIDGDILIDSGSFLTVNSGGNGIYSRSGEIVVKGDDVNVTSNAGCVVSQNCSRDVFIGGRFKGVTTSGSHYGIAGEIVDLSGNVDITAVSDAVVSSWYVNILGTVKAKSTKLNSAAVNARGSSGTIRILKNGYLDATGGASALTAGSVIIMDDGAAGLHAKTTSAPGGSNMEKYTADYICVNAAGNITLRGNCVIESVFGAIRSDTGDIDAEGDLTVSVATVGSRCIVGDNIGIRGGTIDITSYADAVFGTGDISVSGNAVISAAGAKGTALITKNGSVTVGGNVTAQGGLYGVYGGGTVSISDGGRLKAVGGAKDGIYAGGDVLSEGDIDATGNDDGIRSGGEVTMQKDAKLTAGGKNGDGICAVGYVRLRGESTVTGKEHSIISNEEFITLAGTANVTAEANSALYSGKGIEVTGSLTAVSSSASHACISAESFVKFKECDGAKIVVISESDGIVTGYSSVEFHCDANITAKGQFAVRSRADRVFVYGGNVVINNISENTARTDCGVRAMSAVVSGSGSSLTVHSPEYGIYVDSNCELHGTASIYAGKQAVFSDYLIDIGDYYTITEPAGGYLYETNFYDANGEIAKNIVIDKRPITGSVSISGSAEEVGDTIEAFTEGTPDDVIYTWEVSDNGTTWIPVTRCSGSSEYVVGNEDAGNYIRVKVTAAGHSGALYSESVKIDITPVLFGGIVYTSAVRVGQPAQTARTGLLHEIEVSEPSAVHFRWQVSDDGEGWQNLTTSSAKTSTLTPESGTAGRYVRLTAVVDGYDGTVWGSAKLVGKQIYTDLPTAPALSCKSPYTSVSVNNPSTRQEYLVTNSDAAPTETMWEDAVPGTSGSLVLSCTAGQRVYVHTRFRATSDREAGTIDMYSFIYSGSSPLNPKGFVLNYSVLYAKVGDVVKITVKPTPSDFELWNDEYTVRWFVNPDKKKQTKSVELYYDEACTEPVDSTAAVTAKTVYAKVAAQGSFGAIGVEKQIGYNDVLKDLCYTFTADEDGYYLLDQLAFDQLDMYAGETAVTAYRTTPNKARAGTLTFTEYSVPDGAPALTFTPDTESGTVTVSVPSEAPSGTYSYRVTSSETSGYLMYIKINVTKGTAKVSFDGTSGTGTMADVYVPVGSTYVLPACGFTPPEGYTFSQWTGSGIDGFGYGVPGKKVVINGDTVFTAWYVKHTHTMTFVPAVPLTCNTDGCAAHYECAECGRWYLDKDGTSLIADHKSIVTVHTGHKGGTAAEENRVAVTCTTDGGYDLVQYCTACGEEISRTHKVISSTGHVPGAVRHEYETASTCTSAGSCDEVTYCTVCNEEISREFKISPALDHDLTHYPAKAVTETEDGNLEYYACSRCGCLFSDAQGKSEIIDGSSVIIIAEHHTHSLIRHERVEPTADTDGNIEYWECEKCHKLFSDKNGTNEITYMQTLLPAKGSGLTVAFDETTIAKGGSGSYELTYTGAALMPGIICKENGRKLIQGTDYTLKYTNNINCTEGGAAVTVTFKGDLAGSVTMPFTVLQKPVSDSGIVVGSTLYEAGKIPAPIVSYMGIVLKKGKDYTLSDVSGDKVTLTGIGNFTGTREVTVTSTDRAALKASAIKVALGKVNRTFTGKPQTLTADELKVTDPQKNILSEGTDYKVSYSANTDAGTVKFTVTGIGSRTGSVSKTFRIAPAKNADITVKTDKTAYTWSKYGVTPVLTVIAEIPGGEKYELAAGRDYTAAFSGNKKAGTGKTKLTFLGNYKGAKYTGSGGDFTIEPVKLTSQNTTVIASDMLYRKPAVYKPNVYVIADGMLLTKSDCTVTYNDKDKITLESGNSKDCTVKIDSKGTSYTGNGLGGSYSVVSSADRTDVTKGKLTLSVKSVQYTGKAITFSAVDAASPQLTLTVGKTKLGGNDIEKYFEIYYADNVHCGKATVIISARPDSPYIGSCAGTFTITACSVSAK